jgi:hypothetical protein
MKKLFTGGLFRPLAVLLLAALICASCEEALPEYPGELSGFTFTAEALTAEAAVKDAPAGSFSAGGGAEPLIYKLVSGEGDGEFFRVEGNRLLINRDSLGEGEYAFRARVEDQEGRLLQGDFTLTVYGEGEGPGGPDPGDPGDPGDTTQKPARATNLESSPGIQWMHLRWAAAARAERYEVYYSTGTDFADAVKFAEEPTETELTVTGLADGTAYNFWVVAKNRGGAAAESRMYKAEKTSDPLPAGFLYRGTDTSVFQATNGPTDYYQFRDLGPNAPPDERYAFGYMGPFDSPPGIVKFVRRFENYPGDPVGGKTQLDGIVTDPARFPWDKNRGVIIYERQRGGKLEYAATYFADFQETFPPQAIMGEANGYSSGLGNDQETETLEQAIAKFAHIRSPGGRDAYWTMMAIYYRLTGTP